MDFAQTLVGAGFTQQEAEQLASDEFFRARHSRKTAAEIAQKISKTAGIYSCPESKIREVILKFPPFAGLDHSRVLEQAKAVYGEENSQKIVAAILKFPPFAGLDHSRVLEQAKAVYGKENEQAIKLAILKHPPFAGLDHSRVLRRLQRFGVLAGIAMDEALEHLFSNPSIADHSVRRFLACLDVGRELAKEGLPNGREMLNLWLKHHYISSPYVPGTNRLRISQARKLGLEPSEPPLMKSMRSSLARRPQTA